MLLAHRFSMQNGELREREIKREGVRRGTTASSRTSLRASCVCFPGAQPRGHEREDDPNDSEPPTKRSGQLQGLPRVVQRAALAVSRPEDILAACVGAELVANELGLPPEQTDLLAQVVAELGQNLLRHAGGGTITMAQLGGPIVGVEVFAQDQGSGIANLESCLNDQRHRRAGHPRGLADISAVADEFDIQTGPQGTHVRVVVYA